MLKTILLHPEILEILGSNGHGSKILIADGNFSFSTCPPLTAKKVFLNFASGMLRVTDVLSILKDYIPVETEIVMVPPDDNLQPIHLEFEEILRTDIFFKKT